MATMGAIHSCVFNSSFSNSTTLDLNGFFSASADLFDEDDEEPSEKVEEI